MQYIINILDNKITQVNKQRKQSHMETTNNQTEKNVELLNQLIANGYNNLTSMELYVKVQEWIEDYSDKNSPVSYLGDDLYINYLHYLLINLFDGLINNKAQFVPSQNYAQEYNRVIRGYILGVHNESTDENGFLLDFSNHKLCFGADADFAEEFQKSTVLSKAVQYFDDTFIKSVLDDKTYNNFTKYRELFLIDTIYDNASSFCETQNYQQELFRQSKASELISLVNSDWHIVDLIYLIDLAIQDRFFRKLNNSAPTEITSEIKLIW